MRRGEIVGKVFGQSVEANESDRQQAEDKNEVES